MRQTPIPGTGKKLKRDVSDENLIMTVKVKPNSSMNKVARGQDGTILVWLTCAPVEGKANREMIKLLARKLKVPQSAISIERGERAKDKTILIRGISGQRVEQSLSD